MRSNATWGDQMALNTAAGTIDVYQATDRQTGIDACVSLALASEILSEMPSASSVYVCQPTQGGNVAIDARVPVNKVENVLAAAKQAGIPIRR